MSTWDIVRECLNNRAYNSEDDDVDGVEEMIAEGADT